MDIRQHISLLSTLISTPSLSRQEDQTATIIFDYLKSHGVLPKRKHNNIWATNKHFDADKPTLLLNSHHDTVKPNEGYTLDPYEPTVTEDKLFGLGSNDAGGALVCLIHTFLHFHDRDDLNFNIVLAASAEEEISGQNGIASILGELPNCNAGIVGEPTSLAVAKAEKGLMVLDCYAIGVSGHAARDIGKNAIYEAFEDIQWFRNYQFEKTSALLGPVKMTVAMIDGGYQHNVIPDKCHFVVDVRTTDIYNNLKALEIIRENVKSKVEPRSTRLNSSSIDESNPLMKAAMALNLPVFGSATLSDQALIPFPTIKLGPGKSERSHTPDEFIYLSELENGTMTYIKLLNQYHTILSI